MSERKGWLLALAVAALGVSLRLGAVTGYWVNGDEGLYDFAAHAPAAMARFTIENNAHPPLYFWLLRGVAWVSDDFVWLRLPALICGSLSILVMYAVGRDIAGVSCGLAAALLVALSPGAIALSQVIRPYAFQGLLLAVALWFVLRYLRDRRLRDLVGYAGSATLALFVQYGSFLLAAGVGAVVGGMALARRLDARSLRALALAHIPLALGGAWLFYFQIRPKLMGQAIQREAVEGWLADQFVAGPACVWRGFLGLFDYLAGPSFAAAAGVGFVVGLVVCVRERRVEVAGLCAAALFVAVTLSVLSLYPFGGTRHSFHLAPLVVLPIAVAIGRVMSAGRSRAAAAVAIVALLFVAAAPTRSALGFSPSGRDSELSIPRREMEDLRAVFDSEASRPGLTIVDVETVYMLSPLLREVDAWPSWFGLPRMAVYPWRQRVVVVAPVWNMDADLPARLAPRQLAGVLAAIELNLPNAVKYLERDVGVISTSGSRLLDSIRELAEEDGLSGALTEEVAQSPHVAIFRLRVGPYRQALEDRIRRYNERQRSDAAL
ncbi:MAG: glycosyltransferase family 39 protein [Myxococcota bacterium]